VDWEIRTSAEEHNRVIGVRLHSNTSVDITPKALTDLRADVVDWDLDAIVKLI
jgi:hypothetical protein